jgi:hypothetical protein
VVHRWFASSDDWDDQFEGHSYGWIAFFRLLRLYLTHFPGQHGSAFQLLVPSFEPLADAWRKLVEPLGLANATEQRRVVTPSDTQAFEGVVERTGPQDHPELVVRLDQPAPGFAHLFALPMGGMTFLSVRFFLFGDDAASIAKREEPMWRTWLEKHFPTPAE